MLLRRILQITAGGAFLALIVGYGMYQAEDFRTGPVIQITSPQDGYQADEPMLSLVGKAERVSYLSLNGRQIYTDTNGYFDEELLLTDGYNIITVAGRDAFDRHTEEHVRVILNASSSLLFSSYNLNNEQEFRGQEEQETEE
ncbi:MAG: hypothetical protein WD335_03950 [Candidatus Paceibacterota bacterium]